MKTRIALSPARWLAVLFVSLLAACDTPTTDGHMHPVDMSTPGLALPGPRYYPAGVSAAADGTLFVGSLATGAVTKFTPGSTTPTEFIAAGDPRGVVGVLVDDARSLVYLCAADLSTSPPGSEVRAYDLARGTLARTYAFSSTAFCLDLAMDTAGSLYVTDGNGRVWVLNKGAAALTVWASDPLLAATTPTGVGAEGIAIAGSDVFVTAFSDNRLVRIGVLPDGTAGPAMAIAVSPSLAGPAGLRVDGQGALVVVEGGAGRLCRVVVTGSAGAATPIVTQLNGPTSVVRIGATYWVSEGQLDRYFDPRLGAPTLPFLVRSVAAQ